MSNCDHCRTRVARTTVNRGKHQELRCWSCYEVEQRMVNKQDWRDIYRLEYATTHDLTQRTDETPANLHNRCKRIMMQAGFNFGSSK